MWSSFSASPKYPGKGRSSLTAERRPDTKPICFTSRLLAPGKNRLTSTSTYTGARKKEYHSMTAAAALVDALIVALSERLGADGAKNLQKIHKMKKRYRT